MEMVSQSEGVTAPLNAVTRALAKPLNEREMEMIQNEESRTVKLAFIKLRCIVVLSVLLIAFLEFIIILALIITNNDGLVEKISHALEVTLLEKYKPVNR